jgi:hypothetical protein
MSRIDRRAFVMGCFVVPLAGCSQPQPVATAAAPATLTSASSPCSSPPSNPTPGLLPARFLNCGNWLSNDPPIFIVTGGIP